MGDFWRLEVCSSFSQISWFGLKYCGRKAGLYPLKLTSRIFRALPCDWPWNKIEGSDLVKPISSMFLLVAIFIPKNKGHSRLDCHVVFIFFSVNELYCGIILFLPHKLFSQQFIRALLKFIPNKFSAQSNIKYFSYKSF